MITKVTFKDYEAIKNCMSEEEIREKYGKLIVMSNEEHYKYTHPIRERKVKKNEVMYCENNSISKQHY